jgi:hypothetical protein
LTFREKLLGIEIQITELSEGFMRASKGASEGRQWRVEEVTIETCSCRFMQAKITATGVVM